MTAAPPVRRPASPACHPERSEGSLKLPAGWKRTQLGEVAEFIMGQAPAGSDCNTEGKGTIFVKAGEFGPTFPVVREWTTRPLKFSKDGDVLICVVGATCGKLNLAINSAIGRSVAAIRPRNGLDTKFLYLQMQPKVLELRGSSTGTAQGVLTRGDLGKIDFVVVPLPEQRRIVAEIEKQFTRLEAGVAALRRVQANLHRYRAAVLKAACEGRIVETDTGKWKQVTVGDLATQIQYGYTASASETPGGPRFLRITDIQDRKVDWDSVPFCKISAEETQKFRLESGDLVFARTGATTGKSYLIRQCPEAVFASYLIRLRLGDAVLPAYIYGFFQSPNYWRQIEAGKRGIGQPNVNAQTLSRVNVPLPPVAEQERIVAEVERRLSVVEELSALVTANLQRATRLRQAILQRAFAGELV